MLKSTFLCSKFHTECLVIKMKKNIYKNSAHVPIFYQTATGSTGFFRPYRQHDQSLLNHSTGLPRSSHQQSCSEMRHQMSPEASHHSSLMRVRSAPPIRHSTASSPPATPSSDSRKVERVGRLINSCNRIHN